MRMKSFPKSFLCAALLLPMVTLAGCGGFADGGENGPNSDSGISDADPAIFAEQPQTQPTPIVPSVPAPTTAVPVTVTASAAEPIKIEVRLPQLDEPRFQAMTAPKVEEKPQEKPRQKMGAPQPICRVYLDGGYSSGFSEWNQNRTLTEQQTFPVGFQVQEFPADFESRFGIARVSPTFHFPDPKGNWWVYQGWYGPDHFSEIYFRAADRPGSGKVSAVNPSANSISEGVPAVPPLARSVPPMTAACVGGNCKVQTKGGKKR